MKIRLLLGLVVQVLGVVVARGQNTLFCDDFDAPPASGHSELGVWNERLGTTGGISGSHIIEDSGAPSGGVTLPVNSFVAGITNRVLQLGNEAGDVVELGCHGLAPATAVTLSFDYYEPTGQGGTLEVTLGNGVNNGGPATTAFSVALAQGMIAGHGSAYAPGTVTRVDLVANTSADPLNYADGSTVDPLGCDVWVNGSRVVHNLALASGSPFIAGMPISALRFATGGSPAAQFCYLDNVYIFAGGMIGVTLRHAETLTRLQTQLAELYTRYLPDASVLNHALKDITPEGRYPTLDYSSSDTATFLPSVKHANYLGAMATAYNMAGSAQYHVMSVRDKILAALDYWYETNPRAPSSWDDQVGVPVQIAIVLNLMRDDLTPAQIASGIEILRRGYRESGDPYIYTKKPATGQNLIWIARLQTEAGVAGGDYEHARKAMAAITDEIVVQSGDGIQQDMSFHQHGANMGNASYGLVYAVSSLEIMSFTRNTALAPADAKRQLVTRFVLDGTQWMHHGQAIDFAVMGRKMGSYPDAHEADPLLPGLDLVPGLLPGSSEATAASAWAARIRQTQAADYQLPVGNRVYWKSDYISHQRPGYLASNRSFSVRTVGNETGNGQNLKCYYTSTGSMTLLNTGEEYINIFPCWNWRMIPGITALNSDYPYPLINWGKGATGTTAFVGGVSDGDYGASTIDFDRDKIVAKKSWFFFDDEIVALGAGITAPADGGFQYNTTIEQNWFTGAASYRNGTTTTNLDVGSVEQLTGSTWVLHGTTGYYFPGSTSLRAQVENRTGSWHDINSNLSNTRTVSGPVFSLWVEHGTAPSNQTYAYVVLPNTDATALEAYLAPRILANTVELQAVWNERRRVLQGVFHAAGKVALPSGLDFAVDQPCLLQARLRDGHWEVTVADPTQTLRSITVSITGANHASYLVAMPTGQDAGRSVGFTSQENPYENWRLTHFELGQLNEPGVSGDAADPDCDGMVNLVEYALGGDPNVADALVIAPEVSIESDESDAHPMLTYVQPTDRPELVYSVEWTNDFGPVWQRGEGVVTEIVRQPINGGERVTTRSNASLATQPTQFFRLRVTRS